MSSKRAWPAEICASTIALLALVGTSVTAQVREDPNTGLRIQRNQTIQRQTPNTSFGDVAARGAPPTQGAVLAETRALQQRVDVELRRSAPMVQAFANVLGEPGRREMQGICAALMRNPRDPIARQRLRAALGRHRQHDPEAVARYCLDGRYRQLLGELQARAQYIQGRIVTPAAGTEAASADMRSALQRSQRALDFAAWLSKAIHDTAVEIIQNLRG